MNTPVIYRIQNVISGRSYIGQTINVEKRFGTHKANLRRDKHPNKMLQQAWNKCGEENFVFEILVCVINKSFMTEIEDHVTQFHPKSYNLRVAGDSNAGIKHPPEFGRAISERMRGKPPPNLGHKHSEETKQRMSAMRKGHSWNIGFQMPEEAKRKISQTMKGRPSHLKGKTLSEETRRKMSESHRKRNKAPEENNR